MAIRINYSKCYNNNDNKIGKSNKIDGVSVDVKNITLAEQPINTFEYSIDYKYFYKTDYEIDTGTIISGGLKQRSWFYTSITMMLSYDDYPNLINATSINIPEDSIIKTGIKKYKSTEGLDDVKTASIETKPLYEESFFDDATVQNIVEEKTQDNEISYSEVVNELNDTYSFSGSRIGNATTKWTYEKKDSYMVIYIDIVTKMQVYQGTYSLFLWTEDNIEYDYDTVKFNIEYTAPNIQTSDEETIYGSETGNVTSFSSELFVNGNTISGLDYSYYFAHSELEEFRNGKNILSLTLPVGNFEVDYNTTDLLNINDKCTVEIANSEKTTPIAVDENGDSQTYKVIYTNVRYEDGQLLEDVKLQPVRGEYQNIIFEHTDNVLTGIKDEYINSTTILNIPEEIDGDIITEIGEGFVRDNDNIEKIFLPYTINKIGEFAFSYMPRIRSTISLPSSLVSIEDFAFYGSTISGDLIIPEGVTKIGHYSFAECNKLDGVLSIPSTYKFPASDGGRQFENTSNLKRIIIYSDQIQTDQDISAFNNTGSCDIYVLDNLVETFKQKMPNVDPNRIKSISTMT